MQKRLAFGNGHGGNRKHDWARKQQRRGKRCPVPHRRRCEVQECFPLHVTMRVRAGLESLRGPRAFAVVREALRRGKERGEFRLHQFSVQSNHLHLIVEARDRVALARGMQGLATRMAKALNRTWGRRGRVFAERYHALALRSARQVRNALRYVLNNALKHGRRFVGNRPDPRSSGGWFDGWRGTRARSSGARSLPEAHCPVVAARSFLLAVAWRRLGLLEPHECPRGSS
jgi:REP element-mobilizing transposase RayT